MKTALDLKQQLESITSKLTLSEIHASVDNGKSLDTVVQYNRNSSYFLLYDKTEDTYIAKKTITITLTIPAEK